MNYGTYRMSFQDSEQCARACFTEMKETFNALLHARDALWLVDEQGLWDHMNVDDVRVISDTIDKLEAFCEKRTEDSNG